VRVRVRVCVCASTYKSVNGSPERSKCVTWRKLGCIHCRSTQNSLMINTTKRLCLSHTHEITLYIYPVPTI